MGNLDLTGSFIIGGILLLAMVTAQFHFNNSMQSTNLNEINQITATEFGRIIEYDFKNLGYRVSTGDKIQNLGSSNIRFLTDLNNDGIVDSVSYYTTDDKSALKLVRRTTLDQSGEFEMDVAGFTIQAFDSTGNTTLNRSLVSSLQIDLQLQKDYNVKNEGNAIGVSWSRRFRLENL